MRDSHLYIIITFLLLILYCMMYHTRSYPEGFGRPDCLIKFNYDASKCEQS
jgi:hypothetical protein